MSNLREMPPRGHYLAHEVGQLAGVSGDQIGQWARRGYITPSQGNGRPHVYSYQDIAEAMVVHELREHGASLRSIKTAIRRLRERHGFGWPLQNSPIAAYQGGVVEMEGDETYDLGGKGSEWQSVLTPENLNKISGQLERGGWAVREMPDLRFIEVNPERLSGRPTIRGRRIAAAEVAQLAETPEGREALAEDYEITPEQADDAVRWWRATQDFEHRAA